MNLVSGDKSDLLQTISPLADSDEDLSTGSAWWSDARIVACCVSTFVHLTVLLVLGLVWLASDRQPAVAALDAEFRSTDTLPDLKAEEIVVCVDSKAESELTSGGSSRAYLVQPAPKLELSIRKQALLTTAATDVEWTGADIRETVDLVGSALADVASDGEGSGPGDGQGDGTGGMFGLRPVGRRFVYVLDCSKSMNHPHDSDAKTRFKRMQIELLNSVRGMSAEQEFYFIFFNDYVIRMPSAGLTPATQDLKLKYLTWMARLQADGNTEPMGALQLALRLKPDVIYFLTDGTFDFRVEQALLKVPQTGAAIHTFAFKEHLTDPMREVYSLFDTNDGAQARKLVSQKEFRKTRAVWRSHQLLRNLAARHNGTFKIIP